MRIGIITFHKSYNYGSVLQAFALVQFLTKLGHEAKVIDFTYLYDFKQYHLFKSKKHFINDLFRLKSNYMRKINFEGFQKEYLNLTYHSYKDGQNMDDLNNDFDGFICGSDQIWNVDCTRRVVPEFFLSFAKDDKLKIAYAPSVASERFEGDQKLLKKYIGRLDYVSVREKSTINLVQPYTSKKVVDTLDPTLLLNKDDYKKIEQKSQYAEGKYIFFYQLEENDDLIQWVNDLSKNKNLRVVYIYRKKLRKLKNSVYAYGISPNEFLYLIDHAEYVVTNSFHATVFSTLFEKKFCTFKTLGSSSRMVDLLKKLGLSNRIYSENFNIDDYIDYKLAIQKLEESRKGSIQFLTEALDNEGK